jgi:hypothetical protein
MRSLQMFPWVLLLCAGCGEKMPVAPASGTVTLGGKPLAGATVSTQPIAVNSQNPGPGSFGRTDANGHFELELVKPAVKGAIVGPHRVMISPPSAEQSVDARTRAGSGHVSWTDDPQSHRAGGGGNWPTRFTDGSLTMEVPAGGTDGLRIDLVR